MRSLYSVLLVLLACVSSPAQELTVAAAADLHPAMEQIAAGFEQASGIKLRVSYGSSGNLYQQLRNGAPFDVFLSANVEYPKKLEEAGLVASGTYCEFARGSIVLMVPSGVHADLTEGLHVLLTPAVKKVAIADPGHAPYGQAAVAAIKAEGIYDWVEPKLVKGENISQAASFVLSGAADAGLIAKSLAIAPAAAKQAKFVEVPPKLYPPLLQAMVVLKSSKNQQAAMRFEAYIRSNHVKKILKQYGFGVPQAGNAAD
jgi:molybdate transport system substrate-binding protein